MQQLNIYISYSLNNTSKNTLKEIESILAKKGYDVTFYREGDLYTTSKLDAADLVLFIGKYHSDLSDTVQIEYLSKGQYTELLRSLQNKKPVLFYVEHHEYENEILVADLAEHCINDSNDWKRKYAVVNIKKHDDGYAADIDWEIGLYNWNTTSTDNNLLLLL